MQHYFINELRENLMIFTNDDAHHILNVMRLKNNDKVICIYNEIKYLCELVVENKTVALSEADDYMKTAFKSPVAGKESVTLISCTGDWSQQQKTYLSRQFTRAILVD